MRPERAAKNICSSDTQTDQENYAQRNNSSANARSSL